MARVVFKDIIGSGSRTNAATRDRITSVHRSVLKSSNITTTNQSFIQKNSSKSIPSTVTSFLGSKKSNVSIVVKKSNYNELAVGNKDINSFGKIKGKGYTGIKLTDPISVDEVVIVENVLRGIITDIRAWQKDNNKIASGRSYNGYIADIKKSSNNRFIGSVSNSSKSAEFALNGRGSGTPPSTSEISSWMRNKGINPTDNLGNPISYLSASNAIAKSIGEFGTKAPEIGDLLNNIILGNYNEVMNRMSKSYGDTKANDFMNVTNHILQ